MTVIPLHAEPTRLLLDEPLLRRYWYPVMRAVDLGDGPVARQLLGVDLVLWASPADESPGGAEPTVSVALDRCPHRDARLSLGWMDGCAVVCPYHGWRFGADGRATHIPQFEEDQKYPPRAALTTFRAELRYGWVWVALEDPVLPIPDVPELDRPGWRVVDEPESVWQCSAAHLMDNNLDPSHVAYVHQGTFGTPAVPHVPVADVDRVPVGLVSRYDLPVQSRPGEVGATVRHTEKIVHGPFFQITRITYPDGVVHVMVKACTPESRDRTRQLQFVCRNDTEADRPAADIAAFDAAVWEEDRAILETTWSDYRIDLADNVHLKIDRTSIEYRRFLADVVRGTFPG